MLQQPAVAHLNNQPENTSSRLIWEVGFGLYTIFTVKKRCLCFSRNLQNQNMHGYYPPCFVIIFNTGPIPTTSRQSELEVL